MLSGLTLPPVTRPPAGLTRPPGQRGCMGKIQNRDSTVRHNRNL